SKPEDLPHAGTVKEIDAEAERVAPPAQIRVAPAAAALQHFGNVGIVGLLARGALDRARGFPLVVRPFVERSRHRVQGNQARIDARLNVAAMVDVLGVGAAEEGNVFGGWLLLPVALADHDEAAGFRPDLELVAYSGHSAVDATSTQH